MLIQGHIFGFNWKAAINNFSFIHLSNYWKYLSIISAPFIKLFQENKFVKSTNLLLFNIKSINPIRKYPHIIESMLVFYDIFRMFQNPKQSKYVTLLQFTYKAIQWVPIDTYFTRFIIYAPSFIIGTLFLQ